MLPARSYTTRELIHYAGIDDRFKPMLADRLAADGCVPDAIELTEANQRADEAESSALFEDTQSDWLEDIQTAIECLDSGNKDDAMTLMEELHKKIESHSAISIF